MKLKGKREETDPEINLISLIDVILMLVIFFMLSSTFVQEGRVIDGRGQALLLGQDERRLVPLDVVQGAVGQPLECAPVAGFRVPVDRAAKAVLVA